MAKDFGLLAQRLGNISATIPSGAARLVRGTALVIDQAVVTSTPVDEGTARSNWIASVGQPIHKKISPYSPEGGSGNAEAAMAQAEQTLALYSTLMGPIYLTNNLPYIQRLNEGWSAQAAAGFIERAIAEGRSYMRSGKVRLIR